MEPTFDVNGYPSEETLGYIRGYQDIHYPFVLIGFLQAAWHWPDYVKWEPPFLELHTGGWSGNEDLIRALEESDSLFWPFYWQKSERGGHYYFTIPHHEPQDAA